MSSEEPSFRGRVLRGLIWNGTGTFAGQLISWVSTIVVIRLLSPADYGLMVMATTVISLLTVVSQFGINTAMVQADKVNDREIRQLQGLSILFGLLAWLVAWIAAPWIAWYFKEDSVVPMIRLLGMNFLLMALYIIPQAILLRGMDFKKQAKIDFMAQCVGALTTVTLASHGFGTWALIFGVVTFQVIKMIGFISVQSSFIIPSFQFSGAERFIKFGLKVATERIFYYFSMESDKIIIGRFLGNSALGLYSTAFYLAGVLIDKVVPIASQVSFASFSRIQGDRVKIQANLLQVTRVVAFGAFPIFLGMAAMAPDAIPLILGSKWEPAVRPFQFLCLVMPLRALGSLLPPIIYAVGQPQVNLVNMIIASIGMVVAFLISIRWGLMGVCIAWIVAYPIIFVATTRRSLRALGLGLWPYLNVIVFPALCGVVMVGAILWAKRTFMIQDELQSMLVFVSLGIVIYCGLVMMFGRDQLGEVKTLFLRK